MVESRSTNSTAPFNQIRRTVSRIKDRNRTAITVNTVDFLRHYNLLDTVPIGDQRRLINRMDAYCRTIAKLGNVDRAFTNPTVRRSNQIN